MDGKLVNTGDEAEALLRRLRDHRGPCVLDVETSGLNPRKNHIVGYVFTLGPRPADNYYVPVRHAGGGNLFSRTGPQYADNWGGTPHPFENELIKIAADATWELIGHNLIFDLLFCARHGIFFPQCAYSCTQVGQAVIDENSPGFSLDASTKYMGVTAKKGDDLYAYLHSSFKEEGCPEGRGSMGWYWRSAGDHPLVVGYTLGDGISTRELWVAQQRTIAACSDTPHDEPLTRCWQLEQRVTKTLFNMQHRGLRIDVGRLKQVRSQVEAKIEARRRMFPEGFNERSPKAVRELYVAAGYDESKFQKTPTGRDSFVEEWLETNELGESIIGLRKDTNMLNSFINPLLETHVVDGRGYPHYSQLKQDEYGVISGRLSSYDFNVQQVPAHDEERAPLFRSSFVPEEGYFWSSNDAKQCLAGDTQVMVPGGTKRLDELKMGDLVYSYTDDKNPTIKRVMWSAQTGTRKLYRLHWMTNGRTYGHLDATDDHRIRVHDGSYMSVAELLKVKPSERSKYACGVSVWAMRRTVQTARGKKRNYIFTDGRTRYKESRLVYGVISGQWPEEVHHEDGNTLNDDVHNLSGCTKQQHMAIHTSRLDVTTAEVKRLYNLGDSQRRIARELKCSQKTIWKRLHCGNPGNHIITHIEELPGGHPVYDITVEGTHNFIANEICVHNCEPRIYAGYVGNQLLLDGYRATPTIDLYQTFANITGATRQQCKKLALAIFYNAGVDKTAYLVKCTPSEAKQYRMQLYAMVPEITTFNKEAEWRMGERGWVMSAWGRKFRIADPRFHYKAFNRIIQGSNADFIKLAICDVEDYLTSVGGNVLLTCHDSIEWQLPEGRVAENDEARRVMENVAVKMKLPLSQEVEHGAGRNWAEASFG
jgi:DNA polymerase I-like protein with 3'-5' exonuclease and polymerase domains